MQTYVALTLKEYPSALQAANAARSLQRSLRLTTNEPKQKTERPKPKQTRSKATKSKIAYSSRVFTTVEAEAMPHLRFREVWLVTRGVEYVADCLNTDKKKLVEYTDDRHQACRYPSHEEAKSIMYTLRSVVGPGFDLSRMFVENDK